MRNNRAISKKANSAGVAFENVIQIAIDNYKKRGIANIRKANVPVKMVRDKTGAVVPVRVNNAEPDYYGSIGGKFLCFEAKSVARDYIEIGNRGIKEHQKTALIDSYYSGEISFLLIEFREGGAIYRVNSGILIDAMRERIHICEMFPWHFQVGNSHPLDFLAGLY